MVNSVLVSVLRYSSNQNHKDVQKVSNSILHHYTLPKFPARAARNFGKVDYSDSQSLLRYVVYGRFANAPANAQTKKLFGQFY